MRKAAKAANIVSALMAPIVNAIASPDNGKTAERAMTGA